MAQADFAYEQANDAAGIPLSVSVFADRPHLRQQICDDAAAAGFRLGQTGAMDLLHGGDALPLGELVLVDCPVVSASVLAALARLDLRAAHCGAQMIVSTSVEALEDVFACVDQSRPQILVDPPRAERVIALGRVLAQIPAMGVRELGEEDRLALLRLTEQVGQIAARLEQISERQGLDGSVFRFESPVSDFHGENDDDTRGLVRKPRPPLPDPRLVRRIIRQRQARARFFDGDLFADPAWDILLDLTAARAEHTRVSVTSLCIASGVPPTTALRWISQMTEAGLLERVEDESDKRRAFIALTDKAADAMARYFAEVG